jgi:hypothetical protein
VERRCAVFVFKQKGHWNVDVDRWKTPQGGGSFKEIGMLVLIVGKPPRGGVLSDWGAEEEL